MACCVSNFGLLSFVLSIQVFTGAVPFGNDSFAGVMVTVKKGGRPTRPAHPTFTETLWTLMQRCWHHDPRLRPEVSEALQILLTPSVSHSFW